MKFSIKKKPVKVSFLGLLSLAITLVLATYFVQSALWFLVLYASVVVLALTLLAILVLPYLDTGVEVDGDTIEKVTVLGGIIRLRISNLDFERSDVNAGGLSLVPHTGEAMILSTSVYSKDDILRLAHYIGLTDAGWSQHV
jgi:hypothetical protein